LDVILVGEMRDLVSELRDLVEGYELAGLRNARSRRLGSIL
jgi:hypothetical protein